MDTFKKSLPFTLTRAQTVAIDEILRDVKKNIPMNRLLQGDVGSGKTVVAAAIVYTAFLNGHASLIMAPTEILAQQHFKTLSETLLPLGLTVGLETSSVKSLRRKKNFDLLVGTHALIQEHIKLDKIGLIIIDEQHRFGVKQRALLRSKGKAPHVLTMTGTPIPRTLVLALYGDLELSVLDEMPKGRKDIKTWVVPPVKRQAAYEWIKKQITEENIQTFIVCPFIEPSESLVSVRAATQEFVRLKDIFAGFKLGLLHGKLKSKEKSAILDDFRQKKYDILICTPVVEVGIDIPNATIMLIETAERFGLAQLHQLRGRVGRGEKQSYCLLFTDTPEKSQTSRLKHLERSVSGAKLAELDLAIRGPGHVYGTLQHGHFALKVASLSDSRIAELVKSSASKLLKESPDLDTFPALKQLVDSGTIADIVPD